jgi:hypothetical protein
VRSRALFLVSVQASHFVTVKLAGRADWAGRADRASRADRAGRAHKLDAGVCQQVDVLGCDCRLSDSRLETLKLAECNHTPLKARYAELVAVPDAEQLKVNLRILVKRPRTRRTLGWARLHRIINMRMREFTDTRIEPANFRELRFS